MDRFGARTVGRHYGSHERAAPHAGTERCARSSDFPASVARPLRDDACSRGNAAVTRARRRARARRVSDDYRTRTRARVRVYQRAVRAARRRAADTRADALGQHAARAER